MKKHRAMSNGSAGKVKGKDVKGETAHSPPLEKSQGAACGCGSASALDGPCDGIGPGAHAAGVDSELKKANLKHLKRIEGQVRGIAAMIEEDRYCADIIQQCAAVQESLRSVAKNLFRNHLAHCANHAMLGDKSQQEEMVEELITLVGKIAR